MEKIDERKNNSGNSSTEKVGEHILSGFSMSTVSSFKRIENKDDVYRVKDCMKRFFKSLREQAKEITNFKKKKMKLLPNVQQKSYENTKICYICKEKFEDEHA